MGGGCLDFEGAEGEIQEHKKRREEFLVDQICCFKLRFT